MDIARDKLLEWKRNPVKMVVDEFGVTPDAWQVDLLESFADPTKPRKRIAMQACAGPGKSAGLAWCGLNFLACYCDKGLHPYGAAISITRDNLKMNLWKEFAVWINRSEFFRRAFEQTSQKIFCRDFPDTWAIEARAFPQTADPTRAAEALSGLHAKFLLYLIDESGSMPPAVKKRAVQGLMSALWCRILTAGNPTSIEGLLYDAVTNEAEDWEVLRITGDPEDKKRSSRIDIDEARKEIAKYGRSDPWVMAYILGKFPKSSLNTLLTPDMVRDAMARSYKSTVYGHMQKRLGIDVARFGLDRNVIFPRQGRRAFKPVDFRNADGPAIAARVMRAKEKWGSELELMDATGGWGMSASDTLRNAGHAPIDVFYHHDAINPKYKNRRVEMWMEMAEWVKSGGWLPNIPELVAELCTPTYTLSGGQYILQEKEQVKKLIGRSPDLADALALTFAIPDMPSEGPGVPGAKGRRGKAETEWDPFNQ